MSVMTDNENLQPTPEDLEPLNVALPKIIGRVHKELGEEKKPGAFGGACGFASFMTEHLILFSGVDQPREGIETKVVNTLWLHSAATGLTTAEVAEQIKKIHEDLQYPDVYKYTFQHTVVLVKSGNQFILVDPTFCQFMDSESSMVQQGIGISSNTSIYDPLVQQLYTNGYVPLTDETMRRYLEITSKQDHHPLIPTQVSVTDLYQRTVRSIPDFSKDELDRRLF